MSLKRTALENKLNKVSLVLLWILVIGMPLHTMLFDKILAGTVFSLGGLINLWRDVIILFLFATTLFLRFKDTILSCTGICMFSVLCMLGVFWFFSDSPLFLKTNILRIYVIPMLMVFIMQSLPLSRKQFDDLIFFLLLQGVALTLFGLFQVFILGEGFLTFFGYGYAGELHHSFYIGGWKGSQRLVSTFASPNNCALYLAQIFAICWVNRKTLLQRWKLAWIGLLIIAVGMIATFSRSSWVSVAVLFVVYFLTHKPNLKKIINWRNAIICGCILLGLWLLDLLLLNLRMTNMIISSILGVVTGSDASFMKHLEDLFYPIGLIATNPLGFGFGKSGPIALDILGAGTRLVESSVWLVGYDTGIIGLVMYFLPYLYTTLGVFNKKNFAKQTAGYITLVSLVIFCILPLHQNIESTFLIFLFMGLAQNKPLQEQDAASANSNHKL